MKKKYMKPKIYLRGNTAQICKSGSSKGKCTQGPCGHG